MKAKNNDGTWNVYSHNEGEWIIVSDNFLDCIPRKNITELEWNLDNTLRVVYTFGIYTKTFFYDNVHGTWGFPVRLR